MVTAPKVLDYVPIIHPNRVQEHPANSDETALGQRILMDMSGGDMPFSLKYQPHLNLHTGKLTGCEALLRSYNTGPEKVIRAAEQVDVDTPLALDILNRACKAMHTIYSKGHTEFYVGVNISSRQLNQGFADEARKILEKTEIHPKNITLELTENHDFKGNPEAIGELQMLTDYGFGISIDDLGHGYSTLEALNLFKVSQIKIDKKYINRVEESQASLFIQKAVKVAHAHGEIDVVAEGVETWQQLSAVRELGCDSVQGYFVDKPLPLDVLVDSLN